MSSLSEAGEVLQTAHAGYTLHERILREVGAIRGVAGVQYIGGLYRVWVYDPSKVSIVNGDLYRRYEIMIHEGKIVHAREWYGELSVRIHDA